METVRRQHYAACGCPHAGNKNMSKDVGWPECLVHTAEGAVIIGRVIISLWTRIKRYSNWNMFA